ncbi:hypothetical protein J2751_001578 [Halorubrum alkaliphilum]|uniref:Uncharacterized protein n=1 Tax=Halorubrum alkaliphilum TaxID=261290 RepID=A0A8T4GDP2_9EURY|nr:hypothetical protein [Halorubrum alkaliphilum]
MTDPNSIPTPTLARWRNLGDRVLEPVVDRSDTLNA